MTSERAIAGTDWVHPNEPCYLIYEINRPVPVPTGPHRFRYIIVGRNDKLAEYVEDLGPASSFPTAKESQVKTGGMTDGKAWSEHTVAEAIGIMEEYRESYWDYEDLPRLGNLEDGYQAVMEKRKRPKGRKVFGT